MPRPDWDEYFMNIAREIGTRGTCDRGRNGCIVVKDKRILVTGYAGAPAGLPHCDEVGHLLAVAEYSQQHEDGSVSKHCVRTTHAEQNAICQAAKFGISLDNGILYCKFVPCFVCAKMIINAGIRRVVAERRYHADENTLSFFKQADIKLDVLNEENENYTNQR
jgi:dCMP deaminase